jgi:uncharacterized membrane-anchored protein
MTRRRVFPEPEAAKAPAITPVFWVVKLLIAVGGEATSDYLDQGNHLLTVVVTAGLLVAGLTWQFRVRRYTAAAYWFLVYAVVVFGTGAADALHQVAGLPYAAATLVWAAVLAGVSAAWYRDPGMSVGSVTTRRREATYWAMALATVAAGTTLADFAASSLNLGYGSSTVVFLAAVVVPVVDWCLGLNAVHAYWWAYGLTWPLGASLADYVSQASARGGLGFGDGRTALAATLAVVAAIAAGTTFIPARSA